MLRVCAEGREVGQRVMMGDVTAARCSSRLTNLGLIFWLMVGVVTGESGYLESVVTQ